MTAVSPSSDATLALNGGPRAVTAPLGTWPAFSDDEISAAVRTMTLGKVNYWTGEEGRKFEQEFAAYCGVPFGIALTNGTVAIELCLRAFGIGVGDEVIVPSASFIATASAVVAVGARPVVADIELDSRCLSARTVAPLISSRTKAIIPVHLGGWPVDIDELRELIGERSIRIIEDCAQAHGAKLRGRVVGSLGDAAAYSFCQDKIITTLGEGGASLFKDEAQWRWAWSYKDHGKEYARCFEMIHPPGFRWLHSRFGTNWRLTEPQAAVGRVALANLDQMVAKRRTIAQSIHRAFEEFRGFTIDEPGEAALHAYYRVYVTVDSSQLRSGWTRDRLIAAFNAEGVPCFVGSCTEMYLEDAFAEYRPAKRLPNASRLAENSLALLCHPTLSDLNVAEIQNAVRKVLSIASDRL